MFNIGYTIINAVRIIISVLNMLLMLRIFGVSKGSDIYLLAFSVTASWHCIPMLFTGQFVQFYNDLKADSIEKAHKFYNQSVVFSIFTGIILFIISFVFLKPLVHLYTINLDTERSVLLIQIMRIMVFSILVVPLLNLTGYLLLAEKKFLIFYSYNIIMILTPVLAMGYMLFTRQSDILMLAFSYTAGFYIAAVYAGIIVCTKYIPFRFIMPADFKEFLKNSFMTYLPQVISLCFTPMILNNFLVNFSNGIISCFYYSKNAVEAAGLVLSDYSNKLIFTDISRLVSEKKFLEIRKQIKKFLLFVPAVFAVCAAGLYFCIPAVFKIIFINIGFSIDVNLFQNIFLSLIPWYTAVIAAGPYYAVCAAMKNSTYVIAANILALVSAGIILYCGSKNIYNAAFALFIQLLICLLIYYIFYGTKIKSYLKNTI